VYTLKHGGYSTPSRVEEDVWQIATMQQHQIRRVPVVDDVGCCAGIIAQADIVTETPTRQGAELVREVSRSTGAASR
jgi:CBS-domain-containing membrane protein